VPSISMMTFLDRRRALVCVAGLAAVVLGCSDRPAPALAEARWPNEPPGLKVLTDWGFDQPPPQLGDVEIPDSPGWSIVFGTPPGPDRGWVKRTSDPGAPMSPPYVYDFIYPEGVVEGKAPGSVYFPSHPSGVGAYLPLAPGGLPDADEIYVGFWWKPSKPFDAGPNGNKIAFLFNGGGATGGQQFLILHADYRLHVLPEYPGDYRWRRPNANPTTVTLGEWHRIEWYAQLSTGTLKWWLDGVLQGSHDDVRNSVEFDMFQLNPTWGGNIGAKKKQTDHYWFDHLRLSVGE
jgi:hypothetical protein